MPSGTWTFDGDLLRIVLGPDRRTRALRQARGELAVPVMAIAAVTYSPGRHAQLRLREGADPFLQIGGGQISDWFDPYRLTVPKDAGGAAEYLVDEVRNALTIEQVPTGPTDRYLVDGPAAPMTARADDGIASFDGSRLRFEWSQWASPVKKLAGAQQITLADVAAVNWAPMTGSRGGYLHFALHGAPPQPAHDDPTCLTWGVVRRNRWGSFATVKTKAQAVGGTTSLLAAAVAARLPHPHACSDTTEARALSARREAAADQEENDALLRRLRELRTMLDEGLLTDEEYTAAQQAVLRRF